MSVPTWAIIVAVVMICFGGCSTINNYSATQTSVIAEMQESVIDLFPVEDQEAREIKESVTDSLYGSDYEKAWIVRFGYIGMMVALFYMAAGIILAVGKPISIQLVYTALILSLALVLTRYIFFKVNGTSMMGMGHGLSNVLGGAIDIGLLIVFYSMDKGFFRGETEGEALDDGL